MQEQQSKSLAARCHSERSDLSNPHLHSRRPIHHNQSNTMLRRVHFLHRSDGASKKMTLPQKAQDKNYLLFDQEVHCYPSAVSLPVQTPGTLRVPKGLKSSIGKAPRLALDLALNRTNAL